MKMYYLCPTWYGVISLLHESGRREHLKHTVFQEATALQNISTTENKRKIAQEKMV